MESTFRKRYRGLEIYKTALRAGKAAKRAAAKGDGALLLLLMSLDEEMSSQISKQKRDWEDRQKRESIKRELADNKKQAEENKKPHLTPDPEPTPVVYIEPPSHREWDTKLFYIASRHDDSAEDHEFWQGKVYVDARWHKMVKDPQLWDAIESYIYNNSTETFQWVIWDPVYFITRPNCRHYMLSISAREALGMTPEEIIKKHDMSRKIGPRGEMQTPAKRKLDQYKKRLALHMKMYRERPSETLEKMIEKDKLLIDKWQRMA